MDIKQFIAKFGHIASAPNGVELLRELVLNLAVSGKLTSASSVGSAETYLEEIRAKQAELIKSKEIKPNKKIQKLPSQFPFEIPSNWKWVRFADLCYFSAGRTPPRKEPIFWKPAKYPWFSIADMKHQAIINNARESVSEEARKKSFKCAPAKAGTLLMSFKLTIGRLSVLGEDAYHNEAIISIFPFSEELKEYFFKCLNGFDLSSGNKAALKGNTLNQDSISNILIALPPKEEIPSLISKVDELMSLCDNLEEQQLQKRELQNKLRQSTLQAVSEASSPFELKQHWHRVQNNFEKLFSQKSDVKDLRDLILDLGIKGKLILQDTTDEPADVWLHKVLANKQELVKKKKIPKQTTFTPIDEDELSFQIPRGWVFARLGEFTNKIGSGSTPRGGAKAYVSSGIPFLRSQNIWNDGLQLNGVAYIPEKTHEDMSNTAVKAKDLLLNITGGSLGRCTLVADDFAEANVSQHVSIIRPTDPEIREFLHLCILSPYTQNMIWGRQVGMAREGLSKKVLEQFEIPIPPIVEQKRIVERISELMLICDQLEKKLELADNLSTSLAKTVINKLTGTTSVELESPLKTPKTELIAPLALGKNIPDSKDDAPLAKLLARQNGPINSTDLWQRFGGEIDAFYAQLKTEVAHGWIAEPSKAEMLEKDQ